MMLTHLTGGAVLTLPDDLLWVDEYTWGPVATTVTYLLTGALLVETGTRQAGRPITLVGPADMAWVRRTTVDTLYRWAGEPLSEMDGRFDLRLADGRGFTVAFRHHDTALDAEPVLGYPARGDDDFYRLTLRLMQL